MSDQILIFITIFAVVIGVLGIMIGLFPYAVGKGLDVKSLLSNIQKFIDTSDKVLALVKDTVPSNPVIDILEVITKAAKIGVGDAEQLYHAGNISKDDRASIAESVVYSVLQELKVTVDDNKKALIDAAIKNAVNDLGHSNVNSSQIKN